MITVDVQRIDGFHIVDHGGNFATLNVKTSDGRCVLYFESVGALREWAASVAAAEVAQ